MNSVVSPVPVIVSSQYVARDSVIAALLAKSINPWSPPMMTSFMIEILLVTFLQRTRRTRGKATLAPVETSQEDGIPSCRVHEPSRSVSNLRESAPASQAHRPGEMHDHDERGYDDLLQGLGQRTNRHVLGSGNDMDGYADDLAALIEVLDLRDVTMVGHSTGGGEVALHRTPRHEASDEGGPHSRRSAAHVEVLFRNRFHRGPQEVRYPDLGDAWRGRPDRAREEFGEEVSNLIKGKRKVA